MGCGPLPQPKPDCATGPANLLRALGCFPHPIRPSATGKGNPQTARNPMKNAVFRRGAPGPNQTKPIQARPRKTKEKGLDSLGLISIPSSDSGLFKGLRAIQRKKMSTPFAHPAPPPPHHRDVVVEPQLPDPRRQSLHVILAFPPAAMAI
jgi:hypothetical protein